jgi:hypothetical protein
MQVHHLLLLSSIIYISYCSILISKSDLLFLQDAKLDLKSYDKDNLIQIYLTIDSYLKNSTRIDEVVHQNLHMLTEEQLRTNIIDKLAAHPELNNIEKLKRLTDEFKHAIKISHEAIDFINTLTRDELTRLSIRIEKYHKKQLGMEFAIGGLHDYIWRMSEQEIKWNLYTEITEHKELDNVDKLKDMLSKTNVINKEEFTQNFFKILKNITEIKKIEFDKNSKETIKSIIKQALKVNVINKTK